MRPVGCDLQVSIKAPLAQGAASKETRRRKERKTKALEDRKNYLMKTLLLTLTAALAVAVPSLRAQDTLNPHGENFRPESAFFQLQGARVENFDNKILGTIAFIIVDVQNARIVELVATTPHGFLGMGSKYTGIPPNALSIDQGAHALRLDMSQAKFDAAPRFDKSHVTAATQRERITAMLHYYGLKPWFYLDGQPAPKNEEILRLGHLEQVNHILGMSIIGTQGVHFGRVETVMMDLNKGQISHVMAVTNDPTNPRTVVQPRSLHFNKAGTGLVMDVTAMEAGDKPYFRWANGSRTKFQQESYVNRNIESDNGGVNHAKTMPQGANFRDRQKTSRIKEAIAADASLAGNSRDVEVVTFNAQTTLRGHVGSERDKARIGAIAMREGRPENVSNLIEVSSH